MRELRLNTTLPQLFFHQCHIWGSRTTTGILFAAGNDNNNNRNIHQQQKMRHYGRRSSSMNPYNRISSQVSRNQQSNNKRKGRKKRQWEEFYLHHDEGNDFAREIMESSSRNSKKRGKGRRGATSGSFAGMKMQHYAINQWDENRSRTSTILEEYTRSKGANHHYQHEYDDSSPSRSRHHSHRSSHFQASPLWKHQLDDRIRFDVLQRRDVVKQWSFDLVSQDKDLSLSKDIQLLYTRLQPSVAQQEQVQNLLSQLQTLFKRNFPSSELHLFGSYSNGLALKTSSDVDIMIDLSEDEHLIKPSLPREMRRSASQIIQSLAAILRRARFIDNVKAIPRARIPIVKFSHARCWDADISYNNFLPLYNSHLLQLYSEADPRVRQLIFMIKHWSKRRHISDSRTGTIHSYAYCMMVIHYCQSLQQPLIPVLQNVEGIPEEEKQILFENGENYDCTYVSPEGWQSKNEDSIARLLAGFFEYYSTFDYETQAVSIRQVEPLLKTEKGWHLPQKKSSNIMCIEDPFILDKNVCSLRDEYYPIIMSEFTRAYRLLSQGKSFSLDVCAEWDGNESDME